MMADGYAPPRRTDVALLAAAIEAQDAHVARQRERLFASAERGRPEVGHEAWHQVDVRVGGESYRLRVAQSRGGRYHVELDGKAVDVEAERTGRFERKLTVGDTTFAVLSAPQGSDYLVEVDGTVHRISGGEAGMVRAPAPAMVVSIPVSVGDEVTAGDVVAVVESMKLETALQGPGLRARAGDPGRAEHPGRGRYEAVAAGAGHRRRRGQRFRARVAGGPRHAAGRGLRRRHRGRRRAHLAALPRARLRHRRARRPSAAGRPQRGPPGPAARRPDRAGGRARHLRHLRRPLRAVAQPARARRREPAGRPGGRGGAQPAGVPLRLPALPRRRRRAAPRVVPGQAAPGAVPLRRTRPGAVRRAVLGAVPDVPRAPARRRARAR